jgi:hypothetical protein
MNAMPIIGANVITADGAELGKVKEFEGDCFKVDAPLQPDYWLAPDVIDTASPSTVQLLINRDELSKAIERGSDHKGYHVHRST